MPEFSFIVHAEDQPLTTLLSLHPCRHYRGDEILLVGGAPQDEGWLSGLVDQSFPDGTPEMAARQAWGETLVFLREGMLPPDDMAALLHQAVASGGLWGYFHAWPADLSGRLRALWSNRFRPRNGEALQRRLWFMRRSLLRELPEEGMFSPLLLARIAGAPVRIAVGVDCRE